MAEDLNGGGKSEGVAKELSLPRPVREVPDNHKSTTKLVSPKGVRK